MLRSNNGRVSFFLSFSSKLLNLTLALSLSLQPVKLVPEGYSLFGQVHPTVQTLANGFKVWYSKNMDSAARQAPGVANGMTPGYPGGGRTPFGGASSQYRANPSGRTPLPGGAGPFAGGRTPVPGQGPVNGYGGGRTPLPSHGSYGYGQGGGGAGGYGR